MDFAAVNNVKSAAKTVAITLTNEEAKNPANAFSALLNLGASGIRFNAEHGLSQAEGQWLRAQSQTEREPAPKPKTDADAKPKDKVSAADKSASDDKDDVNAATTSGDQTQDSKAADGKSAQSAGEAQPTDKVASTGLEAIQAVAVQFQILVQLPNGQLQDMGTFDLKALLAAAQQNPDLAAALEAAFGQAADALNAGQSLLGDLTQNLGADPALVAALQQTETVQTADTTDAASFANLFKQIAATFHPLAQQAAGQTQTAQTTQTALAASAATAEHKDATLDLQTPEVAKQSAELSKLLGGDSKIRIQVSVNGQTVADVPFEYSQFNRYSGYNPETMRTMSTANGQVGQGMATNAMLAAANPDTAAPQPQSAPQPLAAAAPVYSGAQTNFGTAQQNGSSGGMPRNDMAQARAPETPAPAQSNGSGTQSPTTSFATALNQAGGNTSTNQAAPAQSPAPTQPQQVIDQIKVNITRAAKAGLDRVTIQLRPEELGRIEIKLEMTEEGNVRAHVTADNPATLELLQREARGLERALQDAGLRAEASDLEFNLRSENNDRLAENGDGRGQGAADNAVNAGNAGEEEAQADDMYDYALAASLRGGVDTYV